MDFYQYKDKSNKADARAYRHIIYANGTKDNVTINQANSGTNWSYGYIDINDFRMDTYSAIKKDNIILHEILHIYGFNDMYDKKKYSDNIMYGYNADFGGKYRNIDLTINNILKKKYK